MTMDLQQYSYPLSQADTYGIIPNTYEGWIIRKDTDLPPGDTPSYIRAKKVPMDCSIDELIQKVKVQKKNGKGSPKEDMRKLKSDSGRHQIKMLLNEKRQQEPNPEAEWILVSVEDERRYTDNWGTTKSNALNVILRRQQRGASREPVIHQRRKSNADRVLRRHSTNEYVPGVVSDLRTPTLPGHRFSASYPYQRPGYPYMLQTPQHGQLPYPQTPQRPLLAIAHPDMYDPSRSIHVVDSDRRQTNYPRSQSFSHGQHPYQGGNQQHRPYNPADYGHGRPLGPGHQQNQFNGHGNRGAYPQQPYARPISPVLTPTDSPTSTNSIPYKHQHAPSAPSIDSWPGASGNGYTPPPSPPYGQQGGGYARREHTRPGEQQGQGEHGFVQPFRNVGQRQVQGQGQGHGQGYAGMAEGMARMNLGGGQQQGRRMSEAGYQGRQFN